MRNREKMRKSSKADGSKLQKEHQNFNKSKLQVIRISQKRKMFNKLATKEILRTPKKRLKSGLSTNGLRNKRMHDFDIILAVLFSL